MEEEFYHMKCQQMGDREQKRQTRREKERKVAEETARAKLRIGHNNFPRNLFERHNIIFYTRKVVGKGREGVGRGGCTHRGVFEAKLEPGFASVE